MLMRNKNKFSINRFSPSSFSSNCNRINFAMILQKQKCAYTIIPEYISYSHFINVPQLNFCMRTKNRLLCANLRKGSFYFLLHRKKFPHRSIHQTEKSMQMTLCVDFMHKMLIIVLPCFANSKKCE